MAAADIKDLQNLFKSTGFYRAKAKNIKNLSQKILIDFNGKVPSNIEDLVTLPGVGRKTANVVLGHGFNIPGITVDTHFGRLSRRFGWCRLGARSKLWPRPSQWLPAATVRGLRLFVLLCAVLLSHSLGGFLEGLLDLVAGAS